MRPTSLVRSTAVLILGDGEIASRIQTSLADLFAQGSQIERLPFAAAGAAELMELERELPRFELVVSALEDLPYRAIYETSLACLRAPVPFVAITMSSDHAIVGPTVIPGETPCVVCAHLSGSQSSDLTLEKLFAYTEPLRTLRLDPAVSGALLDALVRAVTGEVEAWLGGRVRPELLTRMLLLNGKGESRSRPLLRLAGCPLCGGVEPIGGCEEKKVVQARIELAASHEAAARLAAPPDGGLCRSVGIVGGGTAGFLTALGLRKRHPELAITLIESSAVPIIGVGEATTPAMPFFLHQTLGLDIHELFEEVKPTFKLGIRFDWGEDGSYFNYPFGPSHLLEAATYDGHIRDYSLYSMLMSADAFPLAEAGGEEYLPFLNRASAYHLDNQRFVRYLTRKAREAGVELLDLTVADVELAPGGNEVAALVGSDGRRLSFDLYVDCSGFRSLLLEKALGSRFVSFEKTLFNDHAVVADAPHHGVLRPYTRAQAFPCGWCWTIPEMQADHRGYVFSSAFCTVEEAAAEMRRRHPEMGDYRTIRFRSGRHEHFWKGNVVAIGNAYAFVEPLESTALHMVIQEIGLLAESFPLRLGETGVPRMLNRKVNGHWDYLRWFLGLHYRFNQRMSGPYWQACREEADISAFEELIDYFRERGPLSYSDSNVLFDYPDPLWGASGVDVILMGQGVEAKMPPPVTSPGSWRQGQEVRRSLVDRSLPQARALAVWEAQPELRARYVDELRV